MMDLTMAFLTNQVVDYLIGQISQQKFWATIFFGQFFNLKNVYPKFLIRCR
jgi:hypothetical protein